MKVFATAQPGQAIPVQRMWSKHIVMQVPAVCDGEASDAWTDIRNKTGVCAFYGNILHLTGCRGIKLSVDDHRQRESVVIDNIGSGNNVCYN